MGKRELPISAVAVGLAVAFVAVSIMVVVTRNHPTWVRRKLRIGALLLGLTAVVNCGGETVDCYAAPARNEFAVEGHSPWEGAVPVDLSSTDSLDATVSYREGDLFSYRILDPTGVEAARGDLEAADGAFDEESEEFVIPLPAGMSAGAYVLYLFPLPADGQPESPSAAWEWQLEVTEG